MRSLEVAVLFSFIGVVSVFTAFYVDFLTQSAFNDEVRFLAKAAGDSVAGVLRDVLTVASFRGVKEFERLLFTPAEFPTLDAFDYRLILYNVGGVVYVNLSFTGFRGKGTSHIIYIVAVGNFSEVAQIYGAYVYLRGAHSNCLTQLGANLSRHGCWVELRPSREPYVIYLKRK